MYFLGLGIVLLTLKWLEFGPFANLAWWLALSPFELAVAWWAWADASGYTKAKQVEKMDQRRLDRIRRNREALEDKPGVKKK